MPKVDKAKRIQELQQEIQNYKQLLADVNAMPANATGKSIRERALQVFKGDYRAYVVKSALAGVVRQEVIKVCNHSIKQAQSWIDQFQAELDEEAARKQAIEERNRIAEPLLELTYAWRKANPGDLTQREFDCLIALIEDGTIKTEAELAEYGPTRV